MNTLPPSPLPQIHGAITGLAGDVLYGWAFDAGAPDVRLAVEIYVNEACVALVRADLDQGMEAADSALGDGFHGFAVLLRKAWLSDGVSISARIANQGPWLGAPLSLPMPNSSTPAAAPSNNGPATTQVWYTGGLMLHGWAWDAEAPDRHIKVRVFHETTAGSHLVKEVLADQRHPAFIYHSSSDHGFAITLPWSLADGKTHQLAIETDSGKPLNGSPITLCLHPEGARALLPHAYSPGSECEPARKLLDALLETLAPRSAGFDVYSQWLATFQPALPLQRDSATQTNTGIVLVLLIHSGSDQDAARSLYSIQHQRLPSAQIRVLSINSTDAGDKFAQQLATQLADPAVACLVPLQCGDHLPAHALDTLLHTISAENADWCYADCDQDGANGERSNPWFKPAWDETLFYGADLVSPGCALSASAVRRAVQHLAQSDTPLPLSWHSLLAAVIASNTGAVVHLPQVLYHRSSDAPAAPHQVKPDAMRQAALQWLAEQRMPGAQVQKLEQFSGLTRVQWPLPAQLPTISLIVPTRDHLTLVRTCVEGLLTQTDYPALEIIIVDNDSRDPDTLAWLKDIPQRGVRVLRYPHPFNYASINNWAAAQAQGEIIGLINNDIAIRHPEWLREMVSHLLRPGIGAVGARLLWPNGMVQHGGVVVGIKGLAAHTGNHNDQNDPGYLGLHQVARQQSAVTAACLLVRKQDYMQLGGLDAQQFPVAFNDVDFCLRLRQAGFGLVWTPFATLTHAESASRGKEDSPSKAARAQREQRHFQQRWAMQYAAGDPYYHPALSMDYSTGPYGGLALPPRPLNARTDSL
ncbi:MAG: glycosyltransferase family 2 protein [Comamonadaceae bacterium]|nr:glycosyltransferase family 2 protein [Comamonadaceae bacterium]